MVIPVEMIRSWQIMFNFPYFSNVNKIKKPENRIEGTYFSHAIMFSTFFSKLELTSCRPYDAVEIEHK